MPDEAVLRPPTPMLDSLLTETMRLITTAHYVIQCIEGGMDIVEDDLTRLEVVQECTRVTARLTSVLSWLLAQKANAGGEFDGAPSPPATRLFGVDDPRVDPQFLEHRPVVDALSQLMFESGRLFDRVARLDRLQDQAGKEAS
jgi:regulator of CtrA degradation